MSYAEILKYCAGGAGFEHRLKITHQEKNKREAILRFHYSSGVSKVKVVDLRFVINFRNLLLKKKSCRPRKFNFTKRPSHHFEGMDDTLQQFSLFLKERGGSKFVEKFLFGWVQAMRDVHNAPPPLTAKEKKALV